MSEIALHLPLPEPFPSMPRVPAARRGRAALLQTTQASQFHEMEAAFRNFGMLDANDLTELLRTETTQPISRLARWLVDHDIFGIQWQSRTLLPIFQFQPGGLQPRAAVSKVVRELAPVLGDWDVALWFARPNAWLDEALPVDVIETDPRAVFHAARADRYLARS